MVVSQIKQKMNKKDIIKEMKEPEWFWTLLDTLDWEEIDSLFRSNYIGKERRNLFYHFYKPHRVIREYIPIIATVAVAQYVMGIIMDSLEQK